MLRDETCTIRIPAPYESRGNPSMEAGTAREAQSGIDALAGNVVLALKSQVAGSNESQADEMLQSLQDSRLVVFQRRGDQFRSERTSNSNHVEDEFLSRS